NSRRSEKSWFNTYCCRPFNYTTYESSGKISRNITKMERIMNMTSNIAQSLLKIKAVTLSPDDPYTWSSGIKSPIYCDNRVTLAYPEIREDIYKSLINLIKEHANEVEIISGTATAGIPHAAFIADDMKLPMSYVRSKSKGHGKGNQIEGASSKGKKVVVIEDLISTGGSSINAVEALLEEPPVEIKSSMTTTFFPLLEAPSI